MPPTKLEPLSRSFCAAVAVGIVLAQQHSRPYTLNPYTHCHSHPPRPLRCYRSHTPDPTRIGTSQFTFLYTAYEVPSIMLGQVEVESAAFCCN
jgi:hypothetical protein